jgi:hypothetical protein
VNVFLAGDTNFGSVRSADGDVAVAAANGNAGVGGDGFGGHIQIERMDVARDFNGELAVDGMLAVVHGDDQAQENEHADDEQDFAAGDASGGGVGGTARDSPFIELDGTEEDKGEGPPMNQDIAQF